MSEQELGNMMNIANTATTEAVEVPDNAVAVEAPVAAAPEITLGETAEEPTGIPVGVCADVYTFVSNNAALTTGWQSVKLVKADGTEVTDTKKVLVGINDAGTPVTFDCNNLYIPVIHLTGVTSIKVLISGIIIMQPNADIYITKNNVYVYVKDENGARVKMIKYLKAKKDVVQFTEVNRDASHVVDAEYTKFIIKASGGRLYAIVEDLTDLAAMKEGVLKFLNEKVSDINYCIKIEDICLQLGF